MDAKSISGQAVIAGVDEVGRGPLAGPVVAAAVIMPPNVKLAGVTDSKLLSAKKREYFYNLIIEKSLSYGIGWVRVEQIDHINILQASLLAMQRALAVLSVQPDEALIDGNICPALNYPARAIIKGDQKVALIAMASILAKVVRDDQMQWYDKKFPGYGFAQHKGCGTRQHLQALEQLGITPIHRRSFAPVRRLQEQTRVAQQASI